MLVNQSHSFSLSTNNYSTTVTFWLLLNEFKIISYKQIQTYFLPQMKSVLVPTASSFIRSSSSLARRTRQTTMLVVTTPLVKKSLTWFLTASGSWLTSARVCRDFSSSIPSEVELAQASHPCSWNVSLWTTAKSPSWSSPSTLLLR